MTALSLIVQSVHTGIPPCRGRAEAVAQGNACKGRGCPQTSSLLSVLVQNFEEETVPMVKAREP